MILPSTLLIFFAGLFFGCGFASYQRHKVRVQAIGIALVFMVAWAVAVNWGS